MELTPEEKRIKCPEQLSIDDVLPQFEVLSQQLFQECNTIDQFIEKFVSIFPKGQEGYQRNGILKLDVNSIFNSNKISCSAAALLFYYWFKSKFIEYPNLQLLFITIPLSTDLHKTKIMHSHVLVYDTAFVKDALNDSLIIEMAGIQFQRILISKHIDANYLASQNDFRFYDYIIDRSFSISESQLPTYGHIYEIKTFADPKKFLESLLG